MTFNGKQIRTEISQSNLNTLRALYGRLTQMSNKPLVKYRGSQKKVLNNIHNLCYLFLE